jgi:intracellular sulfur oxidation DsrE/DsrF family protein
MNRFFRLLLLSLLPFSSQARNTSDTTVEALLEQAEAPPGVVFEVVSGDADTLERIIPVIQSDVQRLRQRFPELDIAVVTHGQEQFALTRTEQKDRTQLHKQVVDLVSKDMVPVHVCGTYAGWRGLTEEAFPDYVDVAAAGPAQINDYRSLGYILVVYP